MEQRTYFADGMTCGHCTTAVTEEITAIPGVDSVQVDLESKAVVVTGIAVTDAAVLAAIEEAGYDGRRAEP